MERFLLFQSVDNLAISQAHTQIQADLQRKHAELQAMIGQQQQELRRVSEQLLMARLGLLPGAQPQPVMVTVSKKVVQLKLELEYNQDEILECESSICEVKVSDHQIQNNIQKHKKILWLIRNSSNYNKERCSYKSIFSNDEKTTHVQTVLKKGSKSFLVCYNCI